MLTGFNKIGSLERSRPRTKQLCVFVYVSKCVCVCVCTWEREGPWMDVYFCPANCVCVCVRACTLYVYASLHASHAELYVWVMVVGQKTLCSVYKYVKTTEKISHRPNAGIPVALFLYHRCFCTTLQSPQIILSLQEPKCHCSLDYYSRDHLNKHTFKKHWHYYVITLSEMFFIDTTHLTQLWHECNVAGLWKLVQLDCQWK